MPVTSLPVDFTPVSNNYPADHVEAQINASLASLASQINAALAAALVSPALTGTPTAPTAAVGASSTQIATTAFVAAGLAVLSATRAALLHIHSIGQTDDLPEELDMIVGQLKVVTLGLADRLAAEALGDTIRLGSVAGTGDAMTASIPAAQAQIQLVAGQAVEWQQPADNSGPVTLTINGNAWSLRDRGGAELPAGALRAVARYRGIVQDTSPRRIRIAGALTAADLVETPDAKVMTAAERITIATVAPEIAARTAADALGDTIRLTAIAGTGDAVTATIPAAQEHVPMAVGQSVEWQQPADNSGDATLTVAGVTYGLRSLAGDVLTAGALRATVRYRGVIHAIGVGARIRMAGPVTAADLVETSDAKVMTGAERAAIGDIALKTDRTVVDQVTGDRYAYGRPLKGWILDDNDRLALGWGVEGELIAKLGLVAGLNGIAITQNDEGRWVISLGETEGVLDLGPASFDATEPDVTEYIDGVVVAGGIRDADDRYVIWWDEHGHVRVHGLALTPAPDPHGLLQEIAVIGDSLLQPSANTTAWADETDLPVVNRSIGGQQSFQASGRLGGAVVGVTVAGNTISSGANTITHLNGAAITTTSGAWGAQILSTPSDGSTRTIRGRLGLTFGTMTRSTASGAGSAETYAFTPDAGQTLPVTCPPGEVFVADATVVDADYRRIAIIGLGRNDDWSLGPDPIIANIAAIVERMRERGNDRFVILTPPNGNYATERLGGVRYTQLLAIEQAITRRWPQNTFNTRRWLISEGMAALGLTPTGQDGTDKGDDTVQDSLRTDNIHWVSSVYAPMTTAIRITIIDPKGWLE